MKTLQLKITMLLSCVQMWKFFSHFGMRTLLVLYMVDSLRYSDAEAFCINAVFCGLVELGGIFGGIIADRFLGLKRSMIFGSLLLAVGYLSLFSNLSLFVSMSFVIVGCSLFSGNITAPNHSGYS